MIDNAGVDKNTHFGFRTVEARIKGVLVQKVFNSVAPNYDLMNDLMSGGVHRLWKDTFVRWLRPKPDMTVLDVAGGTGDIAFRILRYLGDEKIQVIVCDLTPKMLSVGRRRAHNFKFTSSVTWTCCNAECLPFPDCSMDAYTIAFGLRNVTNIKTTLMEARRVLRPGGRFLCLEFSHVVIPLLRVFYDQYSFIVLPFLGKIVAGNRDAYQYLIESIRCFPDQLTLCQHIIMSGLNLVKYRNLSGGIVAIHSAWRL